MLKVIDKLILGYEFFTFMELRAQVHKKYHVTHRECIVLSFITKSYLLGAKIQVSDILKLEDIASQATLHGVVKLLIKKKLVITKQDPIDGRVKYLSPTPISLKIYKEISKDCLKLIC